MPSAFVTGGSGFIGGRLIRRLVADGWTVKALARSEPSASKIRDAGAEPVMGDLDDVAAMAAGAQGCEYAFHAAAALGEWGRREGSEPELEPLDDALEDAAHDAAHRAAMHG